MLSRLSAFVIWALVTATAVFWGLRLAVHPADVPVHAIAGAGAAARTDLTRLLGARPAEASAAAPAPQEASRFRLLGVMAPRHNSRTEGPGHGGLALIAVDGKPARAFAVGAHVDADLVLRAVSLRTASIGSPGGGQTVLLEIPPLAAPATGTLPPPGAPSAVQIPPPPLPIAPPVATPAGIAPAMAPPPSGSLQQGGGLTQ